MAIARPSTFLHFSFLYFDFSSRIHHTLALEASISIGSVAAEFIPHLQVSDPGPTLGISRWGTVFYCDC